MAIYECSCCHELRDDDYSPPIEDPKDELGLICVECQNELFEGVDYD